jgi:HEAT repeat protein
MRQALEQLLVELQVVTLVRQRLNGARDEWLRAALERDMDGFAGEWQQLRRVVADTGGLARFEALRRLRLREGRYSPADIVLMHESLSDSSAQVRATAARLLGMISEPPPVLMIKKLIDIALRDCDAETRFAAARAIGMLRDHVTSPQLLAVLSNHLFDRDRFYRASAAMVLGQLGEMAGAPTMVRNLTRLLDDEDAYVREAAARALGRIGSAAATPDVLLALTRATQDAEMQVHEAATDSLIILRDLRNKREVELAAAV